MNLDEAGALESWLGRLVSERKREVGGDRDEAGVSVRQGDVNGVKKADL